MTELASDTTPVPETPPSPVLAPLGAFQSQAITRSADHRYTYQGKTYPGVTGILKILGATFQQAAYYGAKQAASVTADMIEAADIAALYRVQGREAFIKGMAATATSHRDRAAQLGSEVHEWADKYIRKEAQLIPEAIERHVQHYVEWWEASGWTLRTSEAMVVHPTFGYGGTLDLLCYDRDRRTVLADIKTGNLYSEAILQLTAYGLAELIQTEAGVFTMPKVDRHVILHVTADGVREIEVAVGTLEQVAWGACLDLHAWKETTKGKRL